MLTETLAECLRQDYTYTVCSPKYSQITKSMKDALERQGFIPVPLPEVPREIYVVDMKQPVVLYHNVQTAIKEPFSTNPRVLRVLDESHKRFQRSLTKLYPGELVLSFNAGIMYNRLIELITAANGMPKEPLPVRTLGKNMCVPFGKILKGIVIPNTVTKVLHTDKVFDSRIHGFRIAEFPEYLPLRSQVRTIKSFRRPVILVDDLLHKGYRIRELDPLFKEENVEIDRLIVGMLSGRGKDLMEIQGRKVESAYFIPSMRIWFVETSMYPFIGGDGVETNADKTGNFLHGVNLIDLVQNYGCDSLRMYELFVGPPEMDCDWDDSGIDGVFRFLNRVWKLVYNNKDLNVTASKDMEYLRNKLVYDITNRLEALTMNTVVSGFMEYTNKIIDLGKKEGGVDKQTLETLVVLLAPFAPHIAEELWKELGHAESVFDAGWPEVDESKLVQDTVEIALQVSGKFRDTMVVSVDADKDSVLAQAKEVLASRLEGKTIVKEIYVPGKIVNIIAK